MKQVMKNQRTTQQNHKRAGLSARNEGTMIWFFRLKRTYGSPHDGLPKGVVVVLVQFYKDGSGCFEVLYRSKHERRTQLRQFSASEVDFYLQRANELDRDIRDAAISHKINLRPPPR